MSCARVRAGCPDRAESDSRPTGHDSPLPRSHCFDGPLFRRHANEWAMVDPGRGLRRTAHGCAAAASQPWMADRAEEQSRDRSDSQPQARIQPVIANSHPRKWEKNQRKTPSRQAGGFWVKTLAMTYSRMRCTLPSARKRFTSEFGMGSGGSTQLLSPGRPWRVAGTDTD